MWYGGWTAPVADGAGSARAVLRLFAAGGLPANVALMRLLMETARPEEAEAAIAAERAAAVSAEPAERLAGLGGLLRRHPQAWATVRGVLGEAEHDRLAGRDGPRHWAAVFDRLARLAPEASVALYALGSPDLLRAATDEVVRLMRNWGLLGRDRHLLEIGCGIGRLTLALAPELASAVGHDVSAEMIAEARRRAAGMPSLRFSHTEGRDLAGVPAASQDVVLAADVFPYLVEPDPALAERHVAEAARVLRPGGALLILNYSYRGDAARDRADLRASFARCGLVAEREGTRDLALWDALAFLGRKGPAGR